jgi:hypothetical protein
LVCPIAILFERLPVQKALNTKKQCDSIMKRASQGFGTKLIGIITWKPNQRARVVIDLDESVETLHLLKQQRCT